MLAIFIILVIIILIEFLVVSLVSSNLVINIEECDISYNEKYNKELSINNLKLSIEVYIFKFVKIATIKVFRHYIEIFKFKIKLDLESKLRKNKNLFEDLLKNIKMIRENKEIINVRNLKPIITEFDLDLSFGTENTFLTTFSIPTISLIISVLLKNSITNYTKEKYNYKIMPRYINANNFKLYLNTKLSFNTVGILFFIQEYKKAKAN